VAEEVPPAAYRRRIVDEELDDLLPYLPAIALEGARGVGKTTTAAQRAERQIRLDNTAMVEIVEADMRGALDPDAGAVLIDEWQQLPPVWDHVRRQVDAGAPPGAYLLTGSAAPVTAPTHTGAGRIVTLRMRPMSLAERALAPATVSLRALLAGARPPLEGRSEVDLGAYLREITASGFPGIRVLPERPRRAQLDGYLARVVEREFPEQGLPVRRPQVLRAWLAAYAAATATTASYNAILDAATSAEVNKPAKTTTIAYRDVLDRLWLLDPVPAWLPGENRLERLTRAPKHHLADPALAAHLLGVDVEGLRAGGGTSVDRRGGSLAGHLFEGLVTLSVLTYAQAAEARVSHLRTEGGRQEIDLIVERRDARVVAIEVKLAPTVTSRDVTHLHWLRDRIGSNLLDAIVITSGPYAYRRQDGIGVVPAALLGP